MANLQTTVHHSHLDAFAREAITPCACNIHVVARNGQCGSKCRKTHVVQVPLIGNQGVYFERDGDSDIGTLLAIGHTHQHHIPGLIRVG